LQEPARVTADTIFEIIYGEFIEELRHNLSTRADEPVPVFPFAYDWRQPLAAVELQLESFVDEVINCTKLLRHYHDANYGSAAFPAKVNLAGHSLGGLVIAGYIVKNDFTKVDKVATIATPFRGSLEAVAKASVGVATLGPSTGASRERESARLTPSLYHLLPSFEGSVIGGPGIVTNLFKVEAWQDGILKTLAEFIRLNGVDPTSPQEKAQQLFSTMLAGARAFLDRVEKLSLPDPKRWLSIVGVDAKTRVKMEITKDSDGKTRFDLGNNDVTNEWGSASPAQRLLTGDNTVPYLGARCGFIPVEQVVCVTPGDFGFFEIKDRVLDLAGFHSALPNMNLVQRLVVSHFQGRKEGDVWGRVPPDLPPGKTWDPPIVGLEPKS
jgi:pimeloyl-ACP methyl ester carboxylesterase